MFATNQTIVGSGGSKSCARKQCAAPIKSYATFYSIGSSVSKEQTKAKTDVTQKKN